jgi:hypothetical protein
MLVGGVGGVTLVVMAMMMVAMMVVMMVVMPGVWVVGGRSMWKTMEVMGVVWVRSMLMRVVVGRGP